ncbi:acyltransferase 3 [Xylogone sp. PMI_703]|nr:acyltransferase 3 [Xylogone sp. PMI_703]
MALLPSYIRRRIMQQNPEPEKLYPTSYLNGLRGLVACLVFVRHFSLPWQLHVDYGYGERDGEYNGLLRLPIVRLLYAGPLVPMFFVVSGYVLSLKPVKLIRIQSWDALLRSLSSTIFHRGIRLFLPTIISTFLVMVSVSLGWFNFDYPSMPGHIPVHPEFLNSFWVQFLDWYKFVLMDLTNPFTWKTPRAEYGPHLWTIPLTFRGSMVAALILAGLARVRRFYRLLLLGAMAIFCLLHTRWELSLFVGGIILCELDLSRQEYLGPVVIPIARQSNSPRISQAIWSSSALLTLYVASFPRYNNGICVPGYQWMCLISTNYHYWDALTGFCIVILLSKSQITQRILTTTPMQYLGKISFSMYIVHEPLLHIIGYHTVPAIWWFTGNEKAFQYQAGFGLGMLVTFILLLWVADVFRELVQQPCERLSVWIEKKCSISNQDE